MHLGVNAARFKIGKTLFFLEISQIIMRVGPVSTVSSVSNDLHLDVCRFDSLVQHILPLVVSYW